MTLTFEQILCYFEFAPFTSTRMAQPTETFADRLGAAAQKAPSRADLQEALLSSGASAEDTPVLGELEPAVQARVTVGHFRAGNRQVLSGRQASDEVEAA